jgi:hypothetical protein
MKADDEEIIATLTIKYIPKLTANEVNSLCIWLTQKADEIALSPQDYSNKFTARFSIKKPRKVIGKNYYKNHIIRKMSMPKRKGDDITHGGI